MEREGETTGRSETPLCAVHGEVTRSQVSGAHGECFGSTWFILTDTEAEAPTWGAARGASVVLVTVTIGASDDLPRSADSHLGFVKGRNSAE